MPALPITKGGGTSLADGQRAIGLSRSGIRPVALAILVVFLLLAFALPYMLYKPHPLQASATGTPRSGPTPLTVSFVGNASGGTGPVSFHWTSATGPPVRKNLRATPT